MDTSKFTADRSGRLIEVDAARGNRFQPGERPWNTGIKVLQHSPATQFKKGHRPQTWLPIGSTRISDRSTRLIEVDG